MARGGNPGLALGLGVWSCFLRYLLCCCLVTLAPQLARVGLNSNMDFFMLVMFALTITANLAGKHLVKGLIAGALGFSCALLVKMRRLAWRKISGTFCRALTSLY